LFAVIENNGDNWDYKAGSVSVSAWTHVAFTFDNPSNMVRLFINGVEAGAGKSFTKDMPNTQAPVRTGKRYSETYPNAFDGIIDEVRIWNFARTSAEIQTSMYKTLAGNESGLIGYWQFDEGSGQVAGDHTINNNHGRLGSTATVDINDPQWIISTAPIPSITHIRVNAGGSNYTDTDGKLWSADQPYTPGYWGYVGGNISSTTDPVANTDDDPLYQKYRYGENRFSYKFDVPNGFYEITMLFVEPYWNSPNKRVFDVSIEGILVLNNWDIYEMEGHDYATTRTYTINVLDGQLNVDFKAEEGYPLVSAIGVSLVPDFQVRVNAGGPSYSDVADKVWYADQPYSSNGWGYVGGDISATTDPIVNTDDDALYQKYRYGESGFEYQFDIPNGFYKISLLFVEAWWTTPNQRVFDVSIEGTVVLDDFDIYALVGHDYAINRDFSVKVTDGQLNIEFSKVRGYPVVSAIEVLTIPAPPPPMWSVPVTIAGREATFVRTFGGDPNATNNYDPGLDVPTAPPSMNYYVYFEIKAFPNYLDTDIRGWNSPYETDIDWILTIKNSAGNRSMLSWNPDRLPAGGSFTLVGRDFNINMRTQNSVTVTGDVILTIQYRYPSDFAIFKFSQQGWYLISLPVEPLDNRLSILFPTATGAYEWNPHSRDYHSIDRLQTKKGYWLSIPAATEVRIRGTSLVSYTEHYTSGWHLIGAVTGTVDFADPNDDPPGSVIAAYGWNTATRQYFQVYPPGTGKLEEKEGYWISVFRECDLTVEKGSALALSEETDKNAVKAFNKLFGSEPPAPPFIADSQIIEQLPSQYMLSENYPNPFSATSLNSKTNIKFALPQAGLTQVYIYNSLGQKIRTLLDESRMAGIHQVAWDGRNDNGELVANGIYFYRIFAGKFVATKKMLLIK